MGNDHDSLKCYKMFYVKWELYQNRTIAILTPNPDIFFNSNISFPRSQQDLCSLSPHTKRYTLFSKLNQFPFILGLGDFIFSYLYLIFQSSLPRACFIVFLWFHGRYSNFFCFTEVPVLQSNLLMHRILSSVETIKSLTKGWINITYNN